MGGELDQIAYLTDEELKRLVNSSILLREHDVDVSAIGKDISSMRFSAVAEVMTGMYHGLSDKYIVGIKYDDFSDITNAINVNVNIITGKVVHIANNYENLLDKRSFPQKVKWFNGDNRDLGERVAKESDLIIGYVLNTSAEYFQFQSESRIGDVAMSGLREAERELSDMLYNASDNLRTLETMRQSQY